MSSKLDFSDLQAVVVHPRDADCEVLVRCLQRLGSRVECVWPPLDRIDHPLDLLICIVDLSTRLLLETATVANGPAVIGVLDARKDENIQLISEVTPHAVIVRPVDNLAVVPNIVLARSNAKFQQRQQSKILRLEETLRSYRKVEQAKAILMQQREISEPEAYNFLREQAMRRRVSVGAIASAVVELNEVLSDKKK